MTEKKKTTIKKAMELYRKLKDERDKAYVIGTMSGLLMKSGKSA